MLKLTLEVLPYGQPRWQRHLGILTIANDGTGTLALGNYDIEFTGGILPQRVMRGRVEGFPSDSGPLALVHEALTALLNIPQTGHATPTKEAT
jgi:hypothetical protein